MVPGRAAIAESTAEAHYPAFDMGAEMGSRLAIGLIALSLSSAAAAAYEFYVEVKGIAQDGPAGSIYLLVQTSRDLDGDGVREEGVLRLTCDGAELKGASFHHNAVAPREAPSGTASGRHGSDPAAVRKEWAPVPPRLTSIGLPKITPKIAKESHGRVFVAPGWQPVTVGDALELCAAAAEAAHQVVKSKSNITNN